MAHKRMFSKSVVRTDQFLDMPPSTRELYFQLNLDADVKGFVSPKGVMRLIGASEDDLKVLIAKEYVIPFQSGVIVVTHWKVNNVIREDHEAPTQFIEEFNSLFINDQGVYSRLGMDSRSTTGELRSRLGKVRLDKIRLDKTNNNQDFLKKDKLTPEKKLANRKLYEETKRELKKKLIIK